MKHEITQTIKDDSQISSGLLGTTLAGITVFIIFF